MMAATLLILSAVVIAHLAAISKGMDALKSGTKIFLIPLMFVAFNSVAAAGGIHVDNIGLLMAVLLFYTLGDILLEINTNKIFFFAGAISFVIGHLLYALLFALFGIQLEMVVMYIGLWFIGFIFLFSLVLDKREEETTYYVIYAACVAVMGIAIGGAAFKSMVAQIMALAGAVSFAFSDSMIVLRRRKKDDREDDMLIMLTYIGANLLLLSSLLVEYSYH